MQSATPDAVLRSGRQGPEDFGHITSLPNGAGLVMAPMAGRESVAVSLLVRVGSRWEPRRLAGVSHFLEHIVFKGTRRFPTSRAVSESIEGIGGVLNASTDKEMTSFWVKVPRDHLELGIGVLFELAFAPTIDEEETERERNVVTEELRMYLDQPGELVQMMFDRLVWGTHPLSRDPAGTRASLARVGATELEGYRRTFYTPERVVVVLAGGFDPSSARHAVEQAFADHPGVGSGATMRRSDGGAPVDPVPEPCIQLRHRRGEQVHLMLGVRCSSYLDPGRWTLDVLNTALGEGMSSRLFLELREEQALAYDVHSFVSRQRDSGVFAVYLATGAERAPTAVRSALRQVTLMAREPMSEEELERTKTQIEGRLRLQLEGTGAMAEFLGHQATLIGQVLSPDQLVAAVRDVSSEAVQSLARQLFNAEGWRLAAVGPLRDPSQLTAALADGIGA